MTFNELRKKEGRISGLVALERIIPSTVRSKAKTFLFLTAPTVSFIVLFFEEHKYVSDDLLYGFMLLVTAFALMVFMLDCFYYAHYFRGSYFLIDEWGVKKSEEVIPYEVMEIVSQTHSSDFTSGFLLSLAGREILERLNISNDEINKFLNSNRKKIYADTINFKKPLKLLSFADSVYQTDLDFVDFLNEKNVSRDDYLRTAAWVTSNTERKKEAFRWWGRDSLGRIKGVGKSWAQADFSYLEHYGHFVLPDHDNFLFKKEIDELEKALVSKEGGSALLVAAEDDEFLVTVQGLVVRITDGTALPQIEHKKVFWLNDSVFGDISQGKDEFVTFLNHLFSQLMKVGDLILVIPNLSTLEIIAEKHGFDVIRFIERHVRESEIHVIALSLRNKYDQALKHNLELAKLFKVIFIENEEMAVTIRALEHKAYDIERITNLFFTYQSLAAIAEGARKIVSDNSVENRALKLFDDFVPRLIQKEIKKVTVKDIDNLLYLKTGKV